MSRQQQHGIDPERKPYLKSFCRQYNRWKRRLNEIHSAYTPITLTGMPSSNSTSDPVARAALEAAELSKYCELIEQCCREADNGIYDALMKNVTQGLSFEKIYPNPPCCRDYFYRKRKLFLKILDEKLI